MGRYALLVAALLLEPAFAQLYPSKPIRLIVPFAAGGGNDNVARLVGRRLGETLGQPVVVDNRPGAGGVLGAELAAKAPPDGYTLFLGGVGSHAINPNLIENLPYDPIRDFAPVELLAQAPLVLVVHPSVPARDVAELVAYARRNPGKLNFASNGNGSSSQLAAVMFESMAGIEMVHVPYKGLSPALTDLLSGQVQLMFSSVVAIVPHVKAGKVRGLATTGAKRLALLPGLPTIAESGFPGYEASSWYGILAPAGTPRDIVTKLNAELSKALEQPEVRNSLLAEGAEPAGGTPEQFAAHIRAEKERLGKIIRDAKIRLQ
ncbi:MAG TPA: tripartite tricarboxylate transporter substrate binding protein [Burkholderiales bacterium]|nr:tripartite tricarboxylate transporter substrate binding protein [Burkholderiales bacterium]HUI99375.1 tripartite tricarboxylate transporter substrate binding protein [Usitatibacter sp.]